MSRSGFISYIEPNEPEMGVYLCPSYSLPVWTIQDKPTSVQSFSASDSTLKRTNTLKRFRLREVIEPIRRIKNKLDRITIHEQEIVKFREFTGNWDLNL